MLSLLRIKLPSPFSMLVAHSNNEIGKKANTPKVLASFSK